MGSGWIDSSVHFVMVLLASTTWTVTRRKSVCLFPCEYKLSTSKAIMKTQCTRCRCNCVYPLTNIISFLMIYLI